MNNCKGFSFLETIAAFSLWSIVITLFIPQLVLITQERMNSQQALKAYKILHEKTQQVAFNEVPMKDEEVIVDNKQYTLSWKEEEEYTKACLHWTNTFKKPKSVCFLLS